MNIITCPTCGQQYDASVSNTCPYCGTPTPNQQTVSQQDTVQQQSQYQYQQPVPNYAQPQPYPYYQYPEKKKHSGGRGFVKKFSPFDFVFSWNDRNHRKRSEDFSER